MTHIIIRTLFFIFSFNCDKIKEKKIQQHTAIVSSEKSENGIYDLGYILMNCLSVLGLPLYYYYRQKREKPMSQNDPDIVERIASMRL